MTSPMSSTTPGTEPGELMEVELEDGRAEPLERVGPSIWGGVYRSTGGQAYFRMIPSAEGVTAEMRDEMRHWRERPRWPGIAPIADVAQKTIDGRSWLLARYDVAARTTLLEELASDDPAARTRAVIAIFRALPRWWARLGAGLLPMPSDILLQDGTPCLLAMPCWGIPGVEALFDHPDRVWYLPPEIICGRPGQVWGNTSDLHALGVTLLQCFIRLPDYGAARTLEHIASGTAFAPERCESRLAFWLQKAAPVQAAQATARRLVHPDPKVRSAVDLGALASQLDDCVEAMDPVKLVTRLWDSSQPQEAMSLAGDILVNEPSYDLYVLAGKVAGRSLRNSLEALSLLEKAVAIDALSPDAYAEQITVICNLRTDIVAQLEAAIDPSFAGRLDATIRNAFGRLPPGQQTAAEVDVARYLLDRGHLAEASQFIYDRLRDEEGRLHWWKFGLMLAYAEAFLGLGLLDQCGAVLTEIKAGLVRVRANRTVPEGQIHAYGVQLASLEVSLHERRKKPSPP